MKETSYAKLKAYLSYLSHMLTSAAVLGTLGALVQTPAMVPWPGWRIVLAFAIALLALVAGFASAAIFAHELIQASDRWRGNRCAEVVAWIVFAMATWLAIFLTARGIRLHLHG